ncbi:transient receptor potential cation channel subfamily V member 5-like isoform X2 [Ptychodera flava]|uniref:transient receptor potential cation channel subfamily V member 5-like isoform X2 n=1 Tax=Ptychodera flava TaxID=63121 RepID=UPI00396A5804
MSRDVGENSLKVGAGPLRLLEKTEEDEGVYSLVNLKGGGKLVDLMRNGKFQEVDAVIKNDVRKYLYDDGQGREIPISTLVERREEERLKNIVNIEKKPRIAKGTNSISMMSLVVNESGFEHHFNDSQDYGTRFCCWDIDKRGTVGETILHMCLLANSFVHNELARKLVEAYPKLVHDIYIGEEYYGESALHMAIVNEDTAMVKFLLEHGAAINERCCGNFFTPEDQKSSRTSCPKSEWIVVSRETNYEGLTYWGEYPLGFAACLGQQEQFRLLREAGGDPRLQDFNGNTVLHMMVIHNRKDMYDLAFSMGAQPDCKNNQGLTPLNLAAKLARKEMFDHILELEREVYWIYGNVTCAAYALNGLDTIDATGEINDKSALHIIVNHGGFEHLDLMDGLIVNILKEKWKHYGRKRFFWRWAFFVLYLIIQTVSFYLRPGKDEHPTTQQVNVSINGSYEIQNITTTSDCYLQYHDTTMDQVRIAFEVATMIGAFLFLAFFFKELCYLGVKNFFVANLKNAPAKAVFLCSLICLLLAIPGRAVCQPIYEDIMVILAILMTCPYFLFFLRPFKLVGPFVVMIYKMIRGDLLKFFAIYIVFLVGFSQAMYIVFIGTASAFFNDAVNAVLGMFIMSLGEFGEIYLTLDQTRHTNVGKLLFVIYMILVTLLLINMLIAMMGNTYTMIAETRKEWLRQWAKIVLVIEQALTPQSRKRMQMKYSQPMATDNNNDRAIVMRWHHTQEDQEEQRRFKELHDKHSTLKFHTRDAGWKDTTDKPQNN